MRGKPRPPRSVDDATRPGPPPARGAVFLDRDNTIIADPAPGYLHDPAAVRLLPGAREGLSALARAGWPLVIVSNQAGIAKGLFGPEAFHAVIARLADLLLADRVRFVDAYFCPHHPDITGPCDCRKPGIALFERAARDHELDLAASWYLGDRWRDVAPALRLGGKALLVTPDGAGAEAQDAAANNVARVADLAGAAAVIVRGVR